MKKLYFLLLLFITIQSFGQTVFINEIHYDNTGADTGEGFEIAGVAGTSLVGYSVVLYNGATNASYATVNLSGTIPDEGSGYGALWFDYVRLQNGAPDGLALYDGTNVLEFLSYEGVITAIDGVALGLTSTNIGVAESSSTAIGDSLQLTDAGWVGPLVGSPGLLNTNQTLSVVKNQIAGFALYPNPVTNGRLYIKSNSTVTKNVEIYSMLGQQVYAKSVQPNETIDIYNLNRGIYMVRIEEDGKIATRKLVIK